MRPAFIGRIDEEHMKSPLNIGK